MRGTSSGTQDCGAVGIDEHEVVWLGAVVDELAGRFRCGTDDNVEAIGYARSFEIRPRDRGAVFLQLERGNEPPFSDGACELHGAVAGQGAELQDAGRTCYLAQHREELALAAGYLGLLHCVLPTGRAGTDERLVLWKSVSTK